jgi:cell wall assembly regulator SMI1
MENYWSTIEQWLSENAPNILNTLNEGADEEKIAHLEELVGKKLPESFKEFYETHDGQQPGSDGLIDAEELLCLDSIIDEWINWKELLDKKYFEDNGVPFAAEPDEEVQNTWWNTLWIPITKDPDGNHYCLDLNPTKAGHKGQIIKVWHDSPEREFIAESFEEWIAHFAEEMENGDYVYSEEWGGIIYKDMEDEC